ncbi:TPA: zonular occludens toxin domain-containing protein [Photobacterium damselae]
MIYLRTGLPGASKTLNSLVELCNNYDPDRPKFYNNVKLLMLDYDVASSFSGWFYGWYFRNLKDKKGIKALTKIMKRIHAEDEFIKLEDVPWLEDIYSSHNHFDTWLYWVRNCYSSKALAELEHFLSCSIGSPAYCFDSVKHFNFHFTHFEDAQKWYELPKRSIIFIDECQKYFRPRGVGGKVPEYISKFETHRHEGYDVHLVTQDSMLIDVNIRRLTGRHIHFHNPFGGKRCSRLEASKAFNPDDFHDKKLCKKKPISHNTKFYGVYWSAEIHTHKFKLPWQLVALPVLLIVVGYSMWSVYSSFYGESSLDTEITQTETLQQSSNPNTTQQAKTTFDYLTSLVEGVYISGSSGVFDGDLFQYTYVFEHKDKGIFNPSELGINIVGLGECSAVLRLHELETVITCNAFHKRVVSDPIREPETIDTSNFAPIELASNLIN